VCTASVVLALALGSLLAPGALAASLGGGNAFSELTQGQQESTTTTPKTTTSTTSTEPTNSQTVILLALGAAVLLLSVIAFVIVRDARRVAPAGDGDSLERGSARDSAARVRRRRAKAKAARQQRKRNR
jgi:beta-lactamase regulating signal transducer with metallopeptidase domain